MIYNLVVKLVYLNLMLQKLKEYFELKFAIRKGNKVLQKIKSQLFMHI